MTVGPVEIFVIAFKDPEFHGEIRAELERLRDGEIIRLVDLLAVRKTEDGVIESIQRSDLEADEALAFGAAVGALIGFGAAGEEGMELGAVWGLRELADGHVFDDEDKWRVAGRDRAGRGRSRGARRAPLGDSRARGSAPRRRQRRRGPLDRRSGSGSARRERDADSLSSTPPRVAPQAARSAPADGRPWCMRQPLLRAFARGSSVRPRTPLSSGVSTSSSAQG